MENLRLGQRFLAEVGFCRFVDRDGVQEIEPVESRVEDEEERDLEEDTFTRQRAECCAS